MENNKEILIGKWLKGEMTAAEEQSLLEWARTDASNQMELDNAEKIWKVSLAVKKDNRADVDAAWADFKTRVEKMPAKKGSIYRVLPMAAATVFIILTAVLVKFYFLPAEQGIAPVAATPAHTDTLVQAELKATEDTFILKAPVLKPLGSSPKRTALVAVTSGDSALVFTLPDNSRVFLNKNTKLTYPEKFSGRERIVYLSGEAFFEVTKNMGEFVVICQDTKTRVLGTSFNVKGYHPNSEVQVTVLTGLVEVSNTDGKNVGKKLLLNPGEQGSFNATNDSAVKGKSTKKSKWWKKNNFRTIIRHLFNKITNNDKEK